MTDCLRVLIVGINYEPEPTGIGPYTGRIARGLRARGHDVRVITTFPHYPAWRVSDAYGDWRIREVRGGVDVSRLRHYVPGRPEGVRRAASEMSFGARAVATPWGSPQVVLCPSPALMSTAMVQFRSRCAFGVQVQDIYSAGLTETGRRGLLAHGMKSIEARVVRKADGVAVIHDRFRERLTSDLGVDPERIRVIRNWTHLPGRAVPDPVEVRRLLGWGEDRVVLHSGAMGAKQDLRNVVEAARRADAGGGGLRFVLMGDGSQRRHLESLATGVRCLEIVDPLPDDLYARALGVADVLLVNELPGLTDMAVPSKLTSYFRAGRPVLAATGPGSTTAHELNESGAGIRVDPGDPDCLLRGVGYLLANPEEAARLGAMGVTYCEHVLNEDSALDSYETWVRELFERKGVRQWRQGL